MNDPFIRTETAIEECEQHLKDSASLGSPIESYLTQHILVILCAEMQQAIWRSIDARATATGDAALSAFTGECAQRIIRSLLKSELAGIVGMFGSSNKETFNNFLTDSDVSIYNSAVKERHTVAHVRSTNVTFAELRFALRAALKVFKAFQTAIQV